MITKKRLKNIKENTYVRSEIAKISRIGIDTSLKEELELIEEIDRLNDIINELDEDIYSLYEDICNSDDTYCYRIPMEIIIDRLDKISSKIAKKKE